MNESSPKRQRINKKSSKSHKRLNTLRSHTNKSSLDPIIPIGIHDSGFKDVRTQGEKIRLLRWVSTSQCLANISGRRLCCK